jgi:hypothetical protein
MSPERRMQVEKKLKRKLDARCSLFVLIYIMNYLDRSAGALWEADGARTDTMAGTILLLRGLVVCRRIWGSIIRSIRRV